MISESPTKLSLKPQKPNKHPYRQPQLLVYGNIRELTQAVGMNGAMDGGGGGMNKSQA